MLSSPARAPNTGEVQKSAFSTNMSIYLGKGTVQGYSHYGRLIESRMWSVDGTILNNLEWSPIAINAQFSKLWYAFSTSRKRERLQRWHLGWSLLVQTYVCEKNTSNGQAGNKVPICTRARVLAIVWSHSLSDWASTLFVCSTFAVMQRVTRACQRQLTLVKFLGPVLSLECVNAC